MKNYNTLEGLEKHYISNHTNKTTEASVWGNGVWYFKEITIRNSFRAFAMVNINTNEYMLRCDPVDDEQYETFELFCEEYGDPEWIVLS